MEIKKVKVHITMKMEIYTKDTGKMISNMEEVNMTQQKEMKNMKDNFLKE